MMVQIESGYLARALPAYGKVYDLNTLIKQVLQRFEDDPPKPEVEMSLRLSDAALPVRGLDGFLQLMIDELVDNAVKFSTSGQMVTVTTIRGENTVRLIVQDKGLGIPEDQLDRVWDRFTQINREAQEQQGVGMGLSLVRETVTAHNGQCEIESQVGTGTAAILTLPLVQVEPA